MRIERSAADDARLGAKVVRPSSKHFAHQISIFDFHELQVPGLKLIHVASHLYSSICRKFHVPPRILDHSRFLRSFAIKTNDKDQLQELFDEHEPLVFGHTLEDQIGRQLEAGFVLTGMFEDRYDETAFDPLWEYLATFVATRALKAI